MMTDWVLSPSWELSELERDDQFDDDDDHVVVMEETNQQIMEDAFGSSSGFMLGEDIEDRWQKQHSTKLLTAGSPSNNNKKKKPRGGNVEQQVSSCVVDGCTADLTSFRDYHRRHKVCELHSKTPVVSIHGKHQRFCQQCSRFHSVGEFDEVKRSCRKRLDGHNRRRRKPRGAESSIYLNHNYDSFLTNHQGAKLLRFGGSPAYTGSPLNWPPKREKSNQQLHVSVVQQSRLTPSSSSRKRKFPFLLGPDCDEQLISEPSSSISNTNASSHHHMGQRLTQLVQPKGALSLLSKHTNTSHHTSNSSIPTSFDPLLSLTNVVRGPNSSSSGYSYTNNNNHLIGMIHLRTQGFLLENETPHVLSFSWGE